LNLQFEVPMEYMYEMECRDVEHILGTLNDGGELRHAGLLGGAYLKYDDPNYGLEWTFIPNGTLKDMVGRLERKDNGYVVV